jgi:hypothetical protein
MHIYNSPRKWLRQTQKERRSAVEALAPDLFLPHINEKIVSIFPTGSSVICDPPVMNTDIDICVLFYGNVYYFHRKLMALGWESSQYKKADSRTDPLRVSKRIIKSPSSDIYGHSAFSTLRKGRINLIATKREDFFDRFDFATRLAKMLNLTQKDARISLFDAILSGEPEKRNIAELISPRPNFPIV